MIAESPASAELEECRAEARKFESRYHTLLESAPDAMIFVNAGARIVLVNAQMEKLFGYSREELIGKDLHMLIPSRFHARHRENITRFFAEPRTRQMGTSLKISGLKRDGTEFRADISLSPLSEDDQTVAIAAVRDISEYVRAQEQIEFDYQIQTAIITILKIALEQVPLDAQLERILGLVLSIPDPSRQAKGLIYVLDDSSGNLSLKAHHGFTEDEAISCAQIPTGRQPDDRPASSCEITRTGCKDTPYELLYKDSSSFTHFCVPILENEKILGLIEIFAREWPEPGGREEVFLRAVAHTLAIIMKRYLAESEKQRLIEQLTESEKLAALGRISANVAHEIRNPLTIVGGFARRLKEKAILEPKEREYADFIVSEVGRLEVILRDILNYSRKTTLQLKTCRIHELIDEVMKRYEDLCKERSIAIRKEYAFTSEIVIDRDRVWEVVGNIVSNAIDAMADGGDLTVGTDREDLQGKPFVTIKVSDTGEGMPADRLSRIFEPFFTTKIAQKGVGLGLSISKKIMEDHGGFITVTSERGKGTTFTLYFPGRQSV